MATSPILTPPSPPATGPVGGGVPAQGMQGGGGTAQSLVKLRMDAQKIAAEAPETAPMMREIDNQINKATMQMIQKRQAAMQATPSI